MKPETATGVVGSNIARISVICQSLTDTLILLQGKRQTLEHRMLTRTFLELLTAYSKIVVSLCSLLDNSTNEHKQDLHTSVVCPLSKINDRAETLTGECLKVLSYNVNYFEQYFELDFIARLHKAHLYKRLTTMSENIESIVANNPNLENPNCPDNKLGVGP